ncbi:hypothetical protein FRC00_006608 [Tulasnella sp. 408]|nr:hypothetical protein FRC00_006608 [Tulasnella sp. 408]
MPTVLVPGQAKPAHALVDAIRHASTPGLKGEVIYRENEPTPPAEDALWSEIRFSGLGEVLLDIVTQGGEGTGPIDAGEVHLQMSSLQALYHIVRNIRASWDKKNPLEMALREKVMMITRSLSRLEHHQRRIPSYVALAREFVTGIISHVMEKLRWDFPFLDRIQTYHDSLLRTAVICLFGEVHTAGMERSKPDPSVVQRAVIIAAVLADSFGFSNSVSGTLISRYGTRRIVDIFQLILKDPDYRDSKLGGILTGMSAVMIHLWVDARIHDFLMNRFWEYQIGRPDDNLVELGPLYNDDSFREENVLRKLIIDHDLFFAFGMMLAGSEKHGCFVRDVFIELVLSFSGAGDALERDCVVHAWSHVMTCLRSISTYLGPLTYRDIQKEEILTLIVWEKFGEDLGIEEAETRAINQANDFTYVDTGITCANIKCTLFGENILGRLAAPLRCSTCRSSASSGTGKMGTTGRRAPTSINQHDS